jgi:hypothetical protein
MVTKIDLDMNMDIEELLERVAIIKADYSDVKVICYRISRRVALKLIK